MAIMNGFDMDTGERVFVPGGENGGFLDDAKATPAWQRFETDFEQSAENKTRLQEIVKQLYGSVEFLTVPQFIDALEAGMNAGEFTRAVVEEPVVEPPVPTDRNGRPLSASQLSWQQHHEWAQSHSSEECSQRAQNDPSFRKFRESSLRLEMNGGVGDAVVNLNSRPEEPKKPSAELVLWAETYRRTSAAEAKRLSRFDTNPNGAAAYNRNFEASIAAGLV